MLKVVEGTEGQLQAENYKIAPRIAVENFFTGYGDVSCGEPCFIKKDLIPVCPFFVSSCIFTPPQRRNNNCRDREQRGDKENKCDPVGERDLRLHGHVHAAHDEHVHHDIQRDGSDQQREGKGHGDYHAGVAQECTHC